MDSHTRQDVGWQRAQVVRANKVLERIVVTVSWQNAYK